MNPEGFKVMGDSTDIHAYAPPPPTSLMRQLWGCEELAAVMVVRLTQGWSQIITRKTRKSAFYGLF